MTAKEMKELLESKLRDEGTYFSEDDIIMTEIKNGYQIVIQDYEHIPFKLLMEQDELFGFTTTVYANRECIYFDSSKYAYDPFDAILDLGYYIGTRF